MLLKTLIGLIASLTFVISFFLPALTGGALLTAAFLCGLLYQRWHFIGKLQQERAEFAIYRQTINQRGEALACRRVAQALVQLRTAKSVNDRQLAIARLSEAFVVLVPDPTERESLIDKACEPDVPTRAPLHVATT